MTVALLWIATGAVAGIVAARATAHLAVSGPLRRKNYRGLELPTAGGVALLLGFLAGVVLVSVLHRIAPSSVRLQASAVAGIWFLVAAFGFGLLGLWDDLGATPAERGWRAHLSALRRGRATTGAIKLAGGAALAFAIVAAGPRQSIWTALADAAIVALAANLFNLLDVRPGRAGKMFCLAVAGLLVVGGAVAPLLSAAAGATLAFLRFDLRERVMLGDAGANALGAIVGLAVVFQATRPAKVVALVLLAGLTVLGDRPGLSRMIERVGFLRRADAAGRVPE